jgi:hypothetical protein
VSTAEYQVLGDVFLIAIVALFALALPGYALVRKRFPESDWNLGGNVGTSVIQPLDLIIAGGYVLLFFAGWKSLPDTMAKAAEKEMTVSGVVINQVGMLILAGLIPAVLFWRADVREFFGLRWEGWKKVFWMAPLFVFGMMALVSLQLGLGWKEWTEGRFGANPQSSVTMLQESKDLALLLVVAFSAVVIAPLTEEVIFRGYLYPVVKRFTDRWFAALFTGVLFGVIHFNVFSLPTLTVIGVVLVILYEKTGSLWITIACHAAFNATTVGANLVPRIMSSLSGS